MDHMQPNNLIYFFIVILLKDAMSRLQEPQYVEGPNTNLGEALQFLREFDREAAGMCYRVSQAQWNFSTNTTTTNKRRMMDEQALHAKFTRLSWRQATSYAWTRLPDQLARRQLKMIAIEGRSALSDEEFNTLQQLIADMKEVYSHARICPFHQPYHSSQSGYCDLNLEPDLTRILALSRDYDEQLHVWRAWRDAVGPPIRSKFIRYVELANRAAQMDGFSDAGDQERAEYEVEDLESSIAEVWATLAPLYRQLHTYVRHRLVQRYGPDRVRPDGPIPAHLLGNMWAQNWKNIADIVLPYQGKQPIDVTSEMLRQLYSPLKIFQTAEEFFTSLGLDPMPPEFWHHSLLEKPVDREVVCRASAWDFCNRKDYRIKQCTDVTMEHLLSTHHEMAHVQYYLQYAKQPLLYRDGANPGFHEAVGDAVGLSVITPRHLQRIGLLSNISDDYESNINFLLGMALEKVAYLPFAYIVDQWRWKVFAGDWTQEDMNGHWWELRLRHQGLVPPVSRTERDFDPGAKYHVAADLPYVRYFHSLVLQFQLYAALCEAAGHQGPLHTCDFYRSREAGRLLSDVLSVGASRPWTEVIRIMSRGKTDRLDSKPLLDYFQPLSTWLRAQNRQERLIGWTTTDKDTALFAMWSQNNGEAKQSTVLLFLGCLLLLLSSTL